MPAFIIYAMGLSISEADEASIKNIRETACLSMQYVNDYFSYEKEFELSQKMQAPERIFNAVAVLMRVDSITASAAKERVKAMAIDHEKEFALQKELYYRQNSNISLDLRKLIEAWETSMAGINYWYVMDCLMRLC